MPVPRSVLVVGAGLAGASTAAALRRAGWSGRLTVVGAEPLPPYDRPPLSKHLLDRDTPEPLAESLGLDLDRLADAVRLGTTAVGLDLDGPQPVVLTEDGEHRADVLVVATGARARRPWPVARTLRTWPDAVALRDALRCATAPRRLVVVGAGWVGAEVAGVAARAGHTVTVVEAGPGPLPPLGGVGSRTAGWYDAAGVRLLTGIGVTEVDAAGVDLADGRRVDADVVLAAVGAVPDTGWLTGVVATGPDGALWTNGVGRVLDGPDGEAHGALLAVGDVARRRSARYGWVPGGHWDAALRGPEALVKGLLDGDPDGGAGAHGPDPGTDPVPYVFSAQLGHRVALLGLPRGDDVTVRELGTGWSALWFDDDRLVAAVVVDAPREVSAVRRLFRAPGLPRLDRDTVADPGAPLLA